MTTATAIPRQVITGVIPNAPSGTLSGERVGEVLRSTEPRGRSLPAFPPARDARFRSKHVPQTAAPSNSSKQVYDAKESLPRSGLGLLISASLFGLGDVHLVPGPCAWFTAPPVGFSAAIFGFGAPRAGPWPLLYSIELRVWLYMLHNRV